jgi:hypothetical protein
VSYACVIPKQSASGVRLQVAARTGDCIRYFQLEHRAPNYEAARQEAQAKFPDRLIVVPMLGEQVPT